MSTPSTTNPPHHPNFQTPQASITLAKQHKTTVIINRDHFRALNDMHGRPGTFVRTIAIITDKLVTALKQQGLNTNEYDPERYEQLIAECEFRFPGSTGTAKNEPANDSASFCCGGPSSEPTPIPTPTNGTPVVITHLTPSESPDRNDGPRANRVPRPRKKK